MKRDDIKAFLDRKVDEYDQPSFISADPVSIPHRFTKKQDIELAGFFAAIFAWGNRTTIIRKSIELMDLMGGAPHDFVLHHSQNDLKRLLGFRHRTFNATDLFYCLSFFNDHYNHFETLEDAFLRGGSFSGIEASLDHFHRSFFSLPDAPERTRKHVAAPFRASTCKRLNMYLRWMVRDDGRGVDFGLWKRIPQRDLVCPLDLHVARVARKLGLIRRQQTDWITALELTEQLRTFDPDDPVKYDFALFSLGI
ncbi:MAG: hypothetical protein JWP27_1473, partial [Flaviaesturariibacter sp.]|nr:hypothetical protein [Flaviaesturariibacter sp.]